MRTIDRSTIWPALAALLMVAFATDLRAQKPEEKWVRDIVEERVGVYKGGGIVVGVVDRGGSYVVGEGLVRDGGEERIDGNTLFEIGSATKVFTSLILADMVVKKEVKLSDKITKYLPRTAKSPSPSVAKITLADLATHRSGLPRLPNDFAPKDLGNPYATYTANDLHRFLSRYKLPRKVGESYEYSNLGAGLLGYLLSSKAGSDYESLVRARITGPLGMENTVIAIPPSQEPRFAEGHAANGEPVPHWDIPTLAGAGALRSNADDLLIFLRLAMGLTESPLSPAMKLAQEPRADATNGMKIGLGWHTLTNVGGKDVDIIWHNGGTGGFHSFIGYDRRTGVGVVILSNNAANCDDLAIRILQGVDGR